MVNFWLRLFIRWSPTRLFLLPLFWRFPEFIIDEGYPDSRLAPLDLLNREYKSRAKQAAARKWLPGSLGGGSPLLREALVGYLWKVAG
jgi:GntR family transcriptional regulator/MocR family aminotransferase